MKQHLFILCLVVPFLFLSSSRAQTVLNVLPFQGILTTTGGVTVPDGVYQLSFRLYSVPSGGSPLWQETQTVTVTNGIFSVLLGSVSSLTLSFDQQYYLGISIGGGTELQPRLLLGAAPYSFYAQRAGSVTSGSVVSVMQGGSGIQVSESGGVVRIEAMTSQSLWNAGMLQGYRLGITSPSVGEVLQWDGNQWRNEQVESNYWGLSGNTLSGSEFLGSVNNQPVVIKVNGQEVFRFNTTGTVGAAWSIQRGGGNVRGLHAVDLQSARSASDQVASGDYSVISGGKRNTASGFGSTVSGGLQNTAGGRYSTAGGGSLNAANGYGSTVNGGIVNGASGPYSTVSGGHWNTASGSYSTVGGGYQNSASGPYSTIGGGYQNSASGSYSTVGGGWQNVASGYQSTVSGGSGNTAAGEYSTVNGGVVNSASGSYSTVGGGYWNTASGYMSAVGSGYRNTAGGDYSWAGGRGMYLSSAADRTFVWGYATSTSAITAAGVFLIGPYGYPYKVGINLSVPIYALELPNNSSYPIGKARANAWVTYSDVRIKGHVQPVRNALQLLHQLRPVYYFQHNSTIDQWGRLAKVDSSGSWRYGFIAQELVKVLPEAVTVPEDSLQLWGVDYDMLAPVLTAAMQQLAAEVQTLRQENAVLKGQMAKMATLEQQMQQLQQQVRYLLQQLQSRQATTVSTGK